MSPTKCASHHFGPWMIEPEWFRAEVAAIQAGVVKAEAVSTDPTADDAYKWEKVGNIAVIPIAGPTMKIRSKYGGTSSIDVQRAIRMAVEDEQIKGIMIHGDSPGGTVAGCEALAQDIASANKVKPVHTHIEDMGASAFYYYGSQARRITASTGSLVGSLGTRMEVIDSSTYFDKQGIKVIPIDSGGMKSAGLDGTKITDEQLAYFQGIINDATSHFKSAVMAGRGFSQEKTDSLFDGRVHDAAQAKTLGLIDEVESFDSAMQALTTEIANMDATQFNAYAAEHPEAVAGYIEKGKNAGRAEAVQEFRAIREACGEKHLEIAANAFQIGQTADEAKATIAAVEKVQAQAQAQIDAQAKEIERLKFTAGSQGGINTTATAKAIESADKSMAEAEKIADPEARAKAEFAASLDIRNSFADEKTYVAFRKAELAGNVRRNKTA